VNANALNVFKEAITRCCPANITAALMKIRFIESRLFIRFSEIIKMIQNTYKFAVVNANFAPPE
jgi:hypothetical protein